MTYQVRNPDTSLLARHSLPHSTLASRSVLSNHPGDGQELNSRRAADWMPVVRTALDIPDSMVGILFGMSSLRRVVDVDGYGAVPIGRALMVGRHQ